VPARLGVSPARNSVRWRYFLCQAHIEPQLPRRRPLQKKDHILPDTKDHLFDSIGLICFRPLSCPWRSIPIERGNPPGENRPANQRAYSVPKHLIWNARNLPQPLLQDSNLAEEFHEGFWNKAYVVEKRDASGHELLGSRLRQLWCRICSTSEVVSL